MKLSEFLAGHAWWGKLIGAFLGYLVAGPAGALFGILVGNFFDKGLQAQAHGIYLAYHQEKRHLVRTIFFEATFSVLGHMCKADGRVSAQEIRLAKHLIKSLSLNESNKLLAQKLFNEGKKPDFDLTQALNSLKKIAFANPALIKLFVDIQYNAAQLDGFSNNKLRIMEVILHYFSLAPINSDNFFRQRRQDYSSSYSNYQQSNNSNYSDNQLEQAYRLLMVEPNAGKQEVKRAYRRLMSQNHPDKLIAQGASQEKIKAANHKTQLIRKAYDLICTAKGW